jgi:hypothetical protein
LKATILSVEFGCKNTGYQALFSKKRQNSAKINVIGIWAQFLV